LKKLHYILSWLLAILTTAGSLTLIFEKSFFVLIRVDSLVPILKIVNFYPVNIEHAKLPSLEKEGWPKAGVVRFKLPSWSGGVAEGRGGSF
jgi:hypothetical protein